MIDWEPEQSISILFVDALSNRDYYQTIKNMMPASKDGINIQINDIHDIQVNDTHENTSDNAQAERAALNWIKHQDNPPDIVVLLLSPDYYNKCTAFHAAIIHRYRNQEIVVLGIAIAACGFEDTDTIPILFKDRPLEKRGHADVSYQQIVSRINAAINRVRPPIDPPPRPSVLSEWLRKLIYSLGIAYKKAPAIYRYVSIFIAALLIGGLIGYQLHPQTTGPTAPVHILQVSSDQDSGPGTLRDQVANAHDGDVISFDPSVKDIILKSSLEITRSISVWGDSSHAPTLFDQVTNARRDGRAHPVKIESGTNAARIDIYPGLYVTLSNLTFAGDNVSLDNAFIMNAGEGQSTGSGQLLVINCDVSQFASDYNGSFIGNIGGNVEVRNSYFSNNSSHGDGGGAIYNLRGQLRIDQSTFTQNSTDYSGGAIYNVNGVVSVVNSELDANRVLGNNIDVGGGGGAINSANGNLFVSNSKFYDNTSLWDGGALLLNGTTAQIIDSLIQTNNASTKGGGIAVESNQDNSINSSLSLFSSDISNNVVSHLDNSSSAANIYGESISTTDTQQVWTSPRLTSTSISYNPANNPEKLVTLNAEDFNTFCAQLRKNNYVFTGATIGVDLDTTKCISSNADQDRSFNQLHVTVTDVCAALETSRLQHNEDPKQIIDRLASYWDPLSWQCFKNEVKLGNITQGLSARHNNPQQAVPLDQYCRQKINTGAYAYLLSNANKQPTAYDIKCKDPSNALFRINMAEACSMVYGTKHAIDRLVNFKDPQSWECWGPKKS